MGSFEAIDLALCRSWLWIGVTIACYLAGIAIRHMLRNHPLANPVLIAVALTSLMLLATGTPYAGYLRSTWPLTFLLAPATVALGVPVAKNIDQIRGNFWSVAFALVSGSVTSMFVGVALVRVLGGSKSVAMSMLPKAVTTPIAMAVAEQVGGQPALTASLAIVGGILAAVTLKGMLRVLRVTHEHAVGLAAGTAGSGIAAAHVAPLGDGPAAFAAIGVGLNGLITAILAPWIASMWR